MSDERDRESREDRRSSDRRSGRRRADDAVPETAEDINVSNFRLSIKEVIFIVTLVISAASAAIKFNNKLEQAEATNTLNYELLRATVSQAKEDLSKVSKSQEDLKDQVSDLERITSQIYAKTTRDR